jgi:hypothetical protein
VKKWNGLQNGMTRTQLFLLEGEINFKAFKSILDPVRLMTYNHDCLFSFDPMQRKFNGIGEHRESQNRMKDFYNI